MHRMDTQRLFMPQVEVFVAVQEGAGPMDGDREFKFGSQYQREPHNQP